MATLTRRPVPLLQGSRALVRQGGYRCSFSIHFPLRLDCESWDELGLGWFCGGRTNQRSRHRAMGYVIIFSP